MAESRSLTGTSSRLDEIRRSPIGAVELINDLAEAYCTYGFFIGNGAFADIRWERDKQEEKEYIKEQLNNLKLNAEIIDRGPFLYNGKEYYIPGFKDEE